MTKVISLKRKRRNRIKPIKKIKVPKIDIDITVLSLLLVSVISILLGCIAFKFYRNDTIVCFIKEKIVNKFTENFIVIFLFILIINLIFKLFSLLLGTNLFGVLLVYIPVVLKCVCSGYICSYFYNTYKLNGVLFCLIFLIPYFVATTTSLIYLSKEGSQTGKYIYNRVINKSSANMFSIKIYFIRFLITVFFDIIVSLANSYMLYTFSYKVIAF